MVMIVVVVIAVVVEVVAAAAAAAAATEAAAAKAAEAATTQPGLLGTFSSGTIGRASGSFQASMEIKGMGDTSGSGDGKGGCTSN